MYNKASVKEFVGQFLLLMTLCPSDGLICLEEMWACHNAYYRSKCIPVKDVCNGDLDCADGSDEDPAMCVQWNCTAEGWKCPDAARCIDRTLVCDGIFDCIDDIFGDPEYSPDEDLAMCDQWTCSGYWKSQDEVQCIDKKFVCNSQFDCLDESDENSTMCSQWRCPANYWKCLDGLQCLCENEVCNGDPGCKDGSDEDPERCAQWTCPAGYWKCQDRLQCIDETSVCDAQRNDCSDGSDEFTEICTQWACPARQKVGGQWGHTISGDSTKCASNLQCVQRGDVCDGTLHCKDGSDELCHDHCLSKYLEPGEEDIVKRCKEDLTVCIPVNEYCDGIAQCPDGSDEICTCEKWGLVSCSYASDTIYHCLNANWAPEGKWKKPVTKCQAFFNSLDTPEETNNAGLYNL